MITLNFDGASRNNPGPASAGIKITKDNKILFLNGFYLGNKTNNQAEYLALILGLFFTKKYLTENEPLEIISDSELIVRQLKGIYKVRDEQLKQLYNIVYSMLNGVQYTIRHVLRHENKEADKKANEAIDKKLQVTPELLNFLHENNISI